MLSGLVAIAIWCLVVAGVYLVVGVAAFGFWSGCAIGLGFGFWFWFAVISFLRDLVGGFCDLVCWWFCDWLW